MRPQERTRTISSIPNPSARPVLRMLGVWTLILTLAGCGETMTGPETPVEPEPGATTTVYDLDVTARYIGIADAGSCDINLGGQYVNGEFQYKYEISGEGKTYTSESNNYNSRFGVTYSREPEEIIDFSNKTYSWRGLSSSASITVTLFGVEWDGLVKDRRMNNRSGNNLVPFKLGTTTRGLDIGESGCRMMLVYDAKWTERIVEG
ncbi:hypothetical protein [Rhodocaloribacter sp.]